MSAIDPHHHSYRLPLMRADNPRDFLAALGVLRLVQHSFPSSPAWIRWDEESLESVITTPHDLDLDWAGRVCRELKRLTIKGRPGLIHGKIIKTDVATFRAAVRVAVGLAEEEGGFGSLVETLYAAYGSQLRGEDGLVEPTAFSFGNGQSGKNLLLDVAELIAALSPEELLASIHGGATRASMKSLRLHPGEFRAAAYRAHDPGSKVSGDSLEDFPWLNVLAYLGFSFFPTVASVRGSRTTGFFETDRSWSFVYPLWSTPLGSDEVASLLSLEIEAWGPSLGVFARWSATRFSSDKSLYFSRGQPC